MQQNKVNEINTTRVLQSIWRSSGISRADLSRELGLVKSTVTRIVNSLLNKNILVETPDEALFSGVGRKPLCLKINREYGYILGLEIQTDFYNAVAVNLKGEILFSKTSIMDLSAESPIEAFFKILKKINEKLDSISIPLMGIGVAFAGIIDQDNGIIHQSNPFNKFDPVYFIEGVQPKVDVPVIVSNDANCCCSGELIFRKSAHPKNFLFVLGEFRIGESDNNSYWGIAVGMGFVINGKVYSGSTGSAGEFQSILWKKGNEGQLSLTNEEALKITKDKKIMKKAFQELSSHIAFLVNTLNLSNIIIGGEIVEYKEMLKPILEEEIQNNWSYPSKVNFTIDFSSQGKFAVAYGAAGMILEKIFSIPEISLGTINNHHHRVSLID
ncbi:MAG: ROK family transcriptional regulator [Spirochaetaceae bacterium]|nr:ROK family transcriptional regulator [Spirochaetaceae bacterium]